MRGGPIRGPVDSGAPDRLYTLTGGRSSAATQGFDLATVITARGEPLPGMPSEHVRILRLCRRPVAVLELASRLALPVGVVRVLLADLLTGQHITAHAPTTAAELLPPSDMLRKVLRALHNL
ncbi:hypothetical protein RVR_5137 [Actinacidiphila reveromycinica]|uniref:DUF742 domain-containing protein n=1 Tax=Actinacidiphila reveromycinica TaxID=659352 RepID=A0A7U3VPL7_9ACTN|nr:DUF742 domain-containing protein [Streptomyces sp. SN-593]BBA98799.1 hypothetical protein RVR_5137 [Streptomyces sp. SN-593]